jgi:hypothetical protein
MKCPNCNNEINANYRFCSFCGNDLNHSANDIISSADISIQLVQDIFKEIGCSVELSQRDSQELIINFQGMNTVVILDSINNLLSFHSFLILNKKSGWGRKEKIKSVIEEANERFYFLKIIMADSLDKVWIQIFMYLTKVISKEDIQNYLIFFLMNIDFMIANYNLNNL